MTVSQVREIFTRLLRVAGPEPGADRGGGHAGAVAEGGGADLQVAQGDRRRSRPAVHDRTRVEQLHRRLNGDSPTSPQTSVM